MPVPLAAIQAARGLSQQLISRWHLTRPVARAVAATATLRFPGVDTAAAPTSAFQDLEFEIEEQQLKNNTSTMASYALDGSYGKQAVPVFKIRKVGSQRVPAVLNFVGPRRVRVFARTYVLLQIVPSIHRALWIVHGTRNRGATTTLTHCRPL